MTAPRGGPLVSPGYWVHHAALTWRNEIARRLKPLGLTPTQFDVLASLSWVGHSVERPTQQQVADFSGIDRMMTSKVLRTLVDRGLVVREAHPEDARANRLTLTDAGRTAVTEATAIARAVDRDLFADVSDVVALRAVLTTVVGRRA